jgi:hypothetical protein
MAPIPMILAVFAFVLFVVATFPVAAPYWNRLVSAGLAFWVAIQVLGYTGVMRLVAPVALVGSLLLAPVASAQEAPAPGLYLTNNSMLGREMTFYGTYIGDPPKGARRDGIALDARWVATKQTGMTPATPGLAAMPTGTWAVRIVDLQRGEHTVTITNGAETICKTFAIPR